MRGPFLLLAHSLKRVRTLVLAIGILLAAFQVFLTLVARSIDRSNAFEQMGVLIPPFLREMLGPALAGFMSFRGIVCLGYFHVAVMSALVAVSIALGTMPTSEIETGLMDVILSRPLARHWVITRTVVVTGASTVTLLLMMMAGTWLGLDRFAPPTVTRPTPRVVLSLASNLGLLMLCWGGVAAAIGSGSRRRGAAGAFTGVLALVTFLLDYVARAWQPAESVGWLSPFRYFSPFDLLMGTPLPLKNVWVLAGIAAAGFTMAYVMFSRRDISS